MGDRDDKRKKPRKKIGARSKKAEDATRFSRLCDQVYKLHEHMAEEVILAAMQRRSIKRSALKVEAANGLSERFDALRGLGTREDELRGTRKRIERLRRLSETIEQAIVNCAAAGGAT